MKTRRLGIGLKVVIPVLVLMLFNVLYISISLYSRSNEDMIAMAKEQALMAAKVSAGEIDGDGIAA